VHGPGRGLAVEAATAIGVVLVPATVLGRVFPQLLAGMGTRMPAVALGRLLAVNTAAGLAGALCAAFVLLPRFGLAGGLAAIAALVAAGAAVAARPGIARAGALASAGLLAVGAVVLPVLHVPWPEAGASGALLYYRDGAAATVSVTEEARGRRTLRVNGRYALGGTDGRLLEARQMHLALLLHPAPRRVLTLGVGTGATAGAALVHPEVTVDGVELLPEVLEAAALFAEENRGVLGHARLVVDDARTFLLATAHAWDVIVSDLFLPWTAGSAALYSVELFELGRARLAPGGLFCQWLPLYQLAPDDLETIVASFAAVFEHVQLWIAYHRTRQPIAALMGTDVPLVADAGALRARAAAAEGGRGLAGLDDPADVAVLYVAGDASLRAAVGGVAPLTDDRPRLEFTAPAAYFHQQELAPRALRWVAARLDRDDGPITGAPVAAAVRVALLGAAAALTRDDGPAELRATLAAFRTAPEIRAIRRSLVAMARERRAAGDASTADGIAAALRRLAPDAPETRLLTEAPTAP
jgi:spermidine synthase